MDSALAALENADTKSSIILKSNMESEKQQQDHTFTAQNNTGTGTGNEYIEPIDNVHPHKPTPESAHKTDVVSQHALLGEQDAAEHENSHPSKSLLRSNVTSRGDYGIAKDNLTSVKEVRSDHISNASVNEDLEAHTRSNLAEYIGAWKWEIVSVALSILVLVASVIVLEHYNGKPLPEWPNGLSLNTITSIFTTALKALLMVAVTASIYVMKQFRIVV
jgi:Protein of unknown function (DUF3176)